ncbi:hypothetical protein SCUCBS95973_001981 [Sporothrix curviconia]|uniref:rRNA adenine N(6)-methyltransferase n=1 Tax=Sporothrix curviconia TaxID=1260050 RepID=A0ABP0B351_9PEZI
MTPLAEKLGETGLWHYGRLTRQVEGEEVKADAKAKAKAKATAKEKAKAQAKTTKTKKVKGDKYRVNIVSEPLCDDILKYVGSSLAARHAGCDLLDIYPGAGLWSRKLHDLLQPRQHILLEPDDQFYQPFLQPLLDKPNVSLVPKSGIVWRDLSNVLETMLPHQVERQRGPDHEPQRNDTLLVTANLAFFPKRSFSMFDSVAQLVLYQFINSIRASSLFHRYGLVRMLLWVEASDRHPLLARSCQRRKRLAIDGELATEWITEIAGPDDFSQWFIRADNLDRASCQQALARMKAAGITMPQGREPKSVLKELGLLLEETVVKEPKKRGRPRKIAEPVAPPETATVVEEDAQKPKKRGPKPKTRLPEEEAAPAPAPKKRGRKPTNPLGLGSTIQDLEASFANAADPLSAPAAFERPYIIELRELEAMAIAGKIGPNGPHASMYKHMLALQYRHNREVRVNMSTHKLLQDRARLAADREAFETETAKRTGSEKGEQRSEDAEQKEEGEQSEGGDQLDAKRAELDAREAKWNADVDSLTVNSRKQFLLGRDNLHLFRQSPPVLTWDRRAYEPLVAQDVDFFPNAPCALLDIQPKAMHPLLRVGRPDKSGDIFELLSRGMIAMSAEPVSKAIESVWPGAADGVLPHCPSLTDRKRGGDTVGGPYGELTVRTLNETQWIEILDAWMKWPFRPTLPQLVARITEEAEADPDDDSVMM